MSDEQRIAEIRARADAATAAPWNVTETDWLWIENGEAVHGPTYHVFESEQRGDGECGSMLKADAEFVAHSRDDIPYLLAALEASEAARAALVEAGNALAAVTHPTVEFIQELPSENAQNLALLLAMVELQWRALAAQPAAPAPGEDADAR